MKSPTALLLDTHAAIWLVEGGLLDAAVDLIVAAGQAEGVFVSPVSAWEIGLLTRSRGDTPARMSLSPDPQSWFAQLMAKPIIKEAALTASIAIASSALPGDFHDDPADRLLVATARERGIPIMTRDRKILDYSRTGFIEAIAC